MAGDRSVPAAASTAFASVKEEKVVDGKKIVLFGWPHEKKNQYILTGYKYHETPWETLEHFTTFTNETTNIATALVEAALGIWLAIATCVNWDRLDTHDRACFLVAAFAYIGATCAIIAYHTCNTHAPAYHISSASDLLAINVSIVAMALCCTAAGVPNRLIGLVFAEDLILLGTLVTVIIAAGGVFAYRIQLTREAPKWTILANVSPAVAAVGGGMLYGLKFPERYFPVSFDLIGNSHNIWHVAYGIALIALTYDCFTAALVHGA